MLVTPCMGVWIETPHSDLFDPGADRHTLYGCVDWNSRMLLNSHKSRVTPCMGVWIETLKGSIAEYSLKSHTLYGCVDWNKAWRKVKL